MHHDPDPDSSPAPALTSPPVPRFPPQCAGPADGLAGGARRWALGTWQIEQGPLGMGRYMGTWQSGGRLAGAAWARGQGRGPWQGGPWWARGQGRGRLGTWAAKGSRRRVIPCVVAASRRGNAVRCGSGANPYHAVHRLRGDSAACKSVGRRLPIALEVAAPHRRIAGMAIV